MQRPELNQIDEAAPRLKAGIIGPWGLAALAIGVTSPAIGLCATWGPIEATAGPVAPLVFFAALIITLPTVLSYASLTRNAPSAGAAASWLWTTVNPTAGLVAGLVMICYFLILVLATAFTGLTAIHNRERTGRVAPHLRTGSPRPAAALTYTGVNVANIVYFQRIAPANFNVLHNMLVPIAGICLNLYLIYAAFFSALWSAPFRTGKSVVVICLALFALLLVSAACMRLFRRELLTGPAPVSVDATESR